MCNVNCNYRLAAALCRRNTVCLAYVIVNTLYKVDNTIIIIIIIILHVAESFLRGLQLVKKSPHFTEPEGSLPHSQVPATCPYPEPVRSPISHLLKIHLNIILPSAPGSPQWSLSLQFPHQNPIHAPPLPHTLHMPRPSHSS